GCLPARVGGEASLLLAPVVSPTPAPATTIQQPKIPSIGLWDRVEPQIFNWAPIIFMGLLVHFIWPTNKLMPKTKPQEIKPDSKASIGWNEVAGADEAKAELQEVVDFLRDPDRFQSRAAKVPKGILLHGPPGAGKTLLAKAVAHESGASFY